MNKDEHFSALCLLRNWHDFSSCRHFAFCRDLKVCPTFSWRHFQAYFGDWNNIQKRTVFRFYVHDDKSILPSVNIYLNRCCLRSLIPDDALAHNGLNSLLYGRTSLTGYNLCPYYQRNIHLGLTMFTQLETFSTGYKILYK